MAVLSVRKYLGDVVYPVVTQPDRVESFLVHAYWDRFREERVPKYRALLSGPTLEAEQVELVKGIIRNKQAYHFARKRCEPPHPDFGLRFYQGEQSVILLICLYTAAWEFYASDTEITESWCDPVITPLLSLAKALFPVQASLSPNSVWNRQFLRHLAENRPASR